MADERAYDVVVFGATGFTGFLTAQYLATTASGVRWAIAGRSMKKLEDVADRLGRPAGMGIIAADSGDAEALRAMTRQCRSVATTVGPYMKYGRELVSACIDTRTHYADLTGEFPFIAEQVEAHHTAAKAAGVRIVNCCGYDCIPVDLGTMMAIDGLRVPAVSVRALCTKSNGGPSGGTMESARGIAKWAKDPANKARSSDPYICAPEASPELRVDKQWSTKKGTSFDSDFGTITFPYFMAVTDNRLVRRSLALRNQAVSYDEAMSIGAAARVLGFGLAHAPSMYASMSAKAGEGPAEPLRNAGGFAFEILARGAQGEECRVTVSGRGDPGYLATSVMLAESALCLAFDADGPELGGVLTPSTAMGGALLRRLERSGRFFFTRSQLSLPVLDEARERSTSKL